RINDLGEVVWQARAGGRYQVFLWNGTTVQQLSHGSSSDAMNPCLNNTGQVAWAELALSGPKIAWWDHGAVRSVSADVNYAVNLQINDAGEVMWDTSAGLQRQIYTWDGAAAHGRRISLNGALPSGSADADVAQLNAA